MKAVFASLAVTISKLSVAAPATAGPGYPDASWQERAFYNNIP